MSRLEEMGDRINENTKKAEIEKKYKEFKRYLKDKEYDKAYMILLENQEVVNKLNEKENEWSKKYCVSKMEKLAIKN